MDFAAWRETIITDTTAAGTYQPAFEPVIDTLAAILEQRDAAMDEFLRTGGHFMILHKQDRGAVNPKRNPFIQLWIDLNTQALAYWKELGLTPHGLRKITNKLDTRRGDAGLGMLLRLLDNADDEAESN